MQQHEPEIDVVGWYPYRRHNPIVGTAPNGPLMDTPYTPYDDLPEKLRKEMQLLQHYKDCVNIQARKVVDVAITEWQEADAQVARTSG